MSIAEIAAFVEEQRRRIAQARQAATELATMRIEQEIGWSLGVVVVDVWGDLLEVRLDRAGLRVADPGAVADRLVRAIHAAEARASQIIDEYQGKWT